MVAGHIAYCCHVSCSPIFPPFNFAVKSGQLVGLKYTYSNQWLGCAGRWCGRAGCPERFFSKPNSVCWGEVFRIYSEASKGEPLAVGERVGLYYPREKKWMGCWQNPHCGKYPCPGHPTHAFGFSSAIKWKHCGGEIFTIYAYGKAEGDIILNKDAIMLRFGNKWVSVWGGLTDKRTCPGNPPPGIRKYDQCGGEVFEIYQI